MAVSKEAPAIGIDLGTTYSCVGVWYRGHVEIIANDQGNRITPSCVAFNEDGRLTGEAAQNQAIMNNTIFDMKRLVGRRFSDPIVQSDRKLWPFKVIEGDNDRPMIAVEYKGEKKQFLPEQLSSMVLEKMKETAENFLGCTVKNAVITVPAYFNDSQRRSTRDAGQIAGLNVLRIMVEPTAAAVAYGFDKLDESSNTKKNVLVFDLGGGTFDVSLLSMAPGTIEVIATAGDTHLGGVDFDNRMVEHFMMEFQRKYGKDISKNLRAMSRLKSACERAKRVLSANPQTDVQIDCLHENLDFNSRISRARFEEINIDLFEMCLNIVKNCLKDANIDKDIIDVVVLVGGSTRIPIIENLLQEYFKGINISKRINPDEAVACGVAIQAAKLSGHFQHLSITDVTPLSLGSEVYGGKMDIVVPRNTRIPTKKTSKRITVHDNQSSARFKVYEGERAEAIYNNLLGEFTLNDIAPAPRGEAEMDITFEIDENNLLTVTAEENATGQKEHITISNERGRLSIQEMERMKKDAERYKADDEEYKRKHDAWSLLDGHLYKMKNAIQNENTARKLSVPAKSKIEEVIKSATKVVEQRPLPSTADSENAMEELKGVCHLILLS